MSFIPTNFWTLVGVSCVLLWTFFDYSERFLITNKNTNKALLKFEAIKVPNLKLEPQQKEKILSLYQDHLINEQEKNFEKNQMTLDEQLNQQGLLKSLYVNNSQLTLKAILKNDRTGIQQGQELVALILIIDNLTKAQRIESFKDNSDVFGYHLSIVKNTEVNLTKKHKEGVQNITLAMYKTDMQK